MADRFNKCNFNEAAMKFTVVCLVLIVAVVATTYGKPAKGSTKAALKKKPCLEVCATDYQPVCAGDGTGKNKSFGNECVLSNYNCETGNNLKVQSKGECPGGGGVRLS
ncbi:hypothetical protein MTP99_014967 [Tenebrio molitor]|jgi:hypothetical protein|uniref:turripeptide Lol9.1-like n=1 Tax=Tenebrio molitor TaxID=7067 RepID=UPI0026FC7325|nr:hypothetical protein MTP99_014967 [Tenebrio molitor]